MKSFEKRMAIPKPETIPSSQTAEKPGENVTKTITPEAVGTVEMPDRADGNKGEVLKLPDDVFLGSKARQRRVEGQSRNDDEINRELHSAELATDFNVPTGEYGQTKFGSHREFSYVQTPDGRLHSNKCTLEISGPEKDGVKKIGEYRTINPEGRVTSNERTTERADGTTEKGVEKLGYDSQGNVTVREYSLSVNNKEVYRTETSLDPADPKKTITVVTREERPGYTTKPGQRFSFDGGKKFCNGYGSDMLKLLED